MSTFPISRGVSLPRFREGLRQVLTLTQPSSFPGQSIVSKNVSKISIVPADEYSVVEGIERDPFGIYSGPRPVIHFE